MTRSFLVPVVSLALLAASCGSPPLVPEDYARTFVEVRNCRGTNYHERPSLRSQGGISRIRVLVNAESAQAYRDNANPLPVGTTVIKEEFVDDDCRQMVSWSVMRKEQPGYDGANNDWRWQWVRTDGRAVEDDGRVEYCINCHRSYRSGACLARDFMCTDP